MKLPTDAIQRISESFAASPLGDKRRSDRALELAVKLARRPTASLPAVMRNDAALQAAYRLLNNGAVDFDALIRSSAETTALRAVDAGDVTVLHDTTECTFPHLDPDEIGYLQTGKPGFRLHIALVLDQRGWRRPLGVVHAETLHRAQRSKSVRKDKSGRKRCASGAETAQWEDREYLRWRRGIVEASQMLSGCRSITHVMDREGDSYELMVLMAELDEQFVVRVRVNRRSREANGLEPDWSTVRELAAHTQGIVERLVPLSARKAQPTQRMQGAHPPRNMRIARLQFSATSVEIARPRYLRDPLPKTFTVNVVRVLEVDPPAGEQPVEWLLYTRLPIETPEQVAVVVDRYRDRWTIEEFNSALKTGCAYESRELESRHALVNLLAISLPIACEILALRSHARSNPDAPATDVVSSTFIEVLRHVGERPVPRKPTANEVLLAVAAYGGHLKRNGPPGWKVLYRGMVELLACEVGWNAALASKKRSRQM